MCAPREPREQGMNLHWTRVNRFASTLKAVTGVYQSGLGNLKKLVESK